MVLVKLLHDREQVGLERGELDAGAAQEVHDDGPVGAGKPGAQVVARRMPSGFAGGTCGVFSLGHPCLPIACPFASQRGRLPFLYHFRFSVFAVLPM